MCLLDIQTQFPQRRRTEMATNKLHIFTIVFAASFTLHPGHGFQVIQPHNQTVNADGTASITCQHTANVSRVEDVQLNSLPLTGKLSHRLLCQKGMKDCEGVVLHEDGPNTYLFIILNVGPQAMNLKYECEFTIKVNDVDYTKKGTPTILIAGEREACEHRPTCPAQSHLLLWIVIGVLALMVLYSCAITTAYIGQRFTNKGPENSVYVEMRSKSTHTYTRSS